MSNLRNPAQWLIDYFGPSKAARVTNDTMIGSPAVWYAITTIAGDLAKMPLDVRRTKRDGRGSDKATNHPAYSLLRDEPNTFQTSDVFKEQLQGHALGWGNGRAAIIRNGSRPVELIPIMPDRSDTLMVAGEKYHVTKPDEDDPLRFRQLMESLLEGETVLLNDVIVLHDRDVLHIPGFGWDGIKGKNIATVFKDALGLELGAIKYGNKGMQKGFAGRLMLEDSSNVFQNEDDAARFLANWNKRHGQSQDAEAVAMLRQGMKATVLNMSNDDAEFIEQRKFSRQDVMLIFKLQHIPGDDSSVSYNSLEQKQLAYLASCLDYWLVRWEMQCDCKLRTDTEKRMGRVYHKFNRRTWLATDTKTTQEVLSGYIQSEVLNANEAREVIDLNPRDGGDEYANPAINPAGSEPGDESDESKMVDARLEYLTTVESRRVVTASESEKDFVAWLDGFYSRWPLTLLNNQIPAERVKLVVEQHREDMLAAAGASYSIAELQTNVAEVISAWN
jgi:HK97 family phage portal protein